MAELYWYDDATRQLKNLITKDKMTYDNHLAIEPIKENGTWLI